MSTAMLRTTFAVALLIATPSVVASNIHVPGAKFDGRKPTEGAIVQLKRWTIGGEPTWVHLEGLDFAIAMRPGHQLSTVVDVPALVARKGRRPIQKPETWGGIATLEVTRAERGAELTMTLTPPAGEPFETIVPLGKRPAVSQIWLSIPCERMVVGEWKISIRSTGRKEVVIDDLRWVRLPTSAGGMVFAKPNGFYGPDRLECGALGFSAYTENQTIPLPVQSVRAGSPAARGGLLEGDIIVAVDGASLPVNSCGPGHDWFRSSHESVLGRAVERALASDESTMGLTVVRGASDVELSLPVPTRPPLPKNFPFDDEVTPKLYDDVIDFVRRTRQPGGTWATGGNRWIQTSFAGLALIGRRDPQDRQAIKEIADWFLERFEEPEKFGNLGYWSCGYSGIFLMEYALATGDPRVLPWAERALRWVERGTHTSAWGTAALGHGPDGLPYGQKALMAPATHVIVFEALAKRAGVDSRVWETIYPYMRSAWSDPAEGGHGAMGYNRAARDKGEFWSRTGLFALAAHLRSSDPEMRSAMAKIMRERHAWMRNSHAYGYPGDTWGLIGLSQVDDKAFRHVMREWRWAFGGAWEPGYGLRHTTAHMGSPYMGGEGLINPALAALLSVRHRGLVITGAKDRGWLEVSDLPTRPSAIRLRHESDGRITLRSVVPGNAIHYTTNETAPTASSAQITGSLTRPDGGSLSARTVSINGELGPVATFHLGLPKTDWKILDPSPVDATSRHTRALGAIDGDPKSPWQTDRGREHPTFPFTLTIDLGQQQRFSGVHLPHSTAGEVEVRVATSAAELDDLEPVATATFGRKDRQRIRFGRLVDGRYLKLSLLAGVENGKHLSIGEVNLLWPELSFERDKAGKLVISCKPESDLAIRVSTNDEPPTTSSPAFTAPMALPGRWVQARLFNAEGEPIGPVRVKRFRR